jgi:hypothetical protein
MYAQSPLSMVTLLDLLCLSVVDRVLYSYSKRTINLLFGKIKSQLFVDF